MATLGARNEDEGPLPVAAPTLWVVQKFGGTSLGKYPVEIADIIKSHLLRQNIAVVCSARSSHVKEEGTTTRLLRAAEIAADLWVLGRRDQYFSIIQDIESDHRQASDSTVNSSQLRRQYAEFLRGECHSLLEVLQSVHDSGRVSPEAENKIVSKGEKLACQYLALLLEDRGVPAQCVDLSDAVQRHSIPTNTLENQLYTALGYAFRKEALACGTKVPIITGYFGDLAAGLLHIVGRGYSDLAAALLAIGLSADELQIWKEVDGIFDADPRKVPTAQLLPSVTPSEAAELTYFGSEVIHPHTMDQAIQAKIPIRIKNVMSPIGEGTVITPEATQKGNIPPSTKFGFTLSPGQSSAVLNDVRLPKSPTAVTVKRSVIVLNVRSNKMTRAHGFLARIFQTLDTHHLAVDLIASSEVHVSLALHFDRPVVSRPCSPLPTEGEVSINHDRLKQACEDLKDLGNIHVVTNMAIISLVGQKLKKMIGISGKFLGVLGDNGINIEMISQGASEINISCVISERDTDRALSIVHTNLFKFLE